jgi:hypothetical protein
MSVLVTMEIVVYGTDDAAAIGKAFGVAFDSDLRSRIGHNISDATKKMGVPRAASVVRSVKTAVERVGE